MSKDFSTVSTVLEELISDNAGRNPSGLRLNPKRLIALRGPVMLIVAACLALPAMVAGWFLTPVKYTASAEIRFLASTPRVLSSEGNRDQSTPYEKFLNTQISLISGNTILSRVLNEPAVRDLPCFAKVKDPLQYLKSCVECRVQRNSELVNVNCSLADPESAKRVLEEIVKVYLDYALGAEASAGGKRLSVLTKERDARQLEFESKMRQITDLQGNISVPLQGEGTTQALDTREGELYRESLVRAEEDVSKSQAQLADSEGLLTQIKALQQKYQAAPDKPIFDCGVEERVAQDPRVSVLRQDLVRNEANVAHISEQQLAESPQRREEEKRLASTKASAAQLERQVRRDVLDALEAQFQQQRDAVAKTAEEAQQRTGKFRQQLADFEGRVQKATDQLAQLAEFRSKTDETRNVLDELRREIAQINLESNAAARVEPASPATVPVGGPDRMPRLIAVAMGLFISLGVAVAVGLLLELIDQQVRTPEDVARITRLPVVASLPHASEDESLASSDFAMIAADYPNSGPAEEFRRVLARLLYPEDCSVEVKTLVVASPTRGDGKTSLACNLALVMAEASRRVLLVDLSARGASIEKHFHLEPAEGLAELLHGDCAPEQAVQLTEFENLCVVGPGFDSEDLAGRLASREMLRFMEWAEEGFDHVIIDTPPALLMSDVKLLAPLVDSVVIVVGVGKSTRGMVRRCLREMELVGANMVGVVLNGLRSTRGGYLKHNMRMYKTYAQEGGNGRVSHDVRDIKIVESGSDITLLPFAEGQEARSAKQSEDA